MTVIPGPHIVCPVCQFVPEVDRPPVFGCSPREAYRKVRPESDRWLEYTAHLLEHLLEVVLANTTEPRS